MRQGVDNVHRESDILECLSKLKIKSQREFKDKIGAILENSPKVISAIESILVKMTLAIASEKSSDRESLALFFREQTNFIETTQELSETLNYKNIINKLNPYMKMSEIFQEKKWNIKEFSKENPPILLGEIIDKQKFSTQNEIRVLDMPIKMPGEGWKIPAEHVQFLDLIKKVANHEAVINKEYDDCYCYITIDQKKVLPNVSQRRFGWHTDAFITDKTGVQLDINESKLEEIGYKNGEKTERTYVVADAMPTEFLKGPFDLSQIKKHEEVEAEFTKIAKTKTPFSFPAYTIIQLDPFVVHSAIPNNTDKSLNRTFVKIAFSKYKYNRSGNTVNKNFDYSWANTPREIGKREHRNNIIGNFPDLNDDFLAVDPSVIFDKSTNLDDIEWLENKSEQIQKIDKVSVRKAKKSEIIQTLSVNGGLISENIASGDELVITNGRGQSYAISPKSFQRLYHTTPGEDGLYAPKENKKTIIRVLKNVRLYGPWGGMEYVAAGSGLVIDDKHHLYAIHKEDLKDSYKII